MNSFRVACIVPTYNGRENLNRLIDSLDAQTARFKVYIVDSESNDGTYELAKTRLGSADSVKSNDFNHGGTRQSMVEAYSDNDVFVFLTQDAYLASADAISKIIEPFSDPEIGAVCGRQLPHVDATPIAKHARYFNYPNYSEIRSLENAPTFGIKTAFISNSFAAYRAEALLAVGGFPRSVIFAEDMYVAAKMLLSGWKVAYAGDAKCFHSHNYSFFEEFRRYFDMGVFHAREPWIRLQIGGSGKEGVKFVKSELRFLAKESPLSIPGAIFRSFLKITGYRLGMHEKLIPLCIIKFLSMHKRFWNGGNPP